MHQHLFVRAHSLRNDPDYVESLPPQEGEPSPIPMQEPDDPNAYLPIKPLPKPKTLADFSKEEIEAEMLKRATQTVDG